MPRVNPSMTGSGMNRTYLPAPARPITTRITPAMRPTTSTPSAPWVATIGTRTTVIAPVGPETCTWLPPNSAATTPATTAVTRPAVAPSPEAMPKARARGRATTPTVTPARTS
jgi:hypothetical protein